MPQSLKPFYGDIHNHCGISYGHGPLADALANARQRLDFVSITGHAHWPDMPEPTPRIQHIVDFHLEGFAKLKAGWGQMMDELKAANVEGKFVIFPAFEVHFCACGDRNILYKDLTGEILYPGDLEDLNRQLRKLREQGIDTLAQPHHIGYKKGARGIDWDSFDPEFAPLVELLSMHGCSEESDNTHPFLHVMGPSDWEGTMQYGLGQGHVFGVTGGTDHHSAHPGSYGHGLTGAWAESNTREALWEAFYQRRTWAMTGDRIELDFAVNDQPMGSVIPATAGSPRMISVDVRAGGAIDYVDILKNNRLIHRVSECDIEAVPLGDTIRTKLYLELGWGPRSKTHQWQVDFGVSEGRIVDVEPRFRGRQVVSPLEATDGIDSYFTAEVLSRSDEEVTFTALSEGTPNNFTNTSQGMCLEVEMATDGSVFANLDGKRIEMPLRALIAGARSDTIEGIESNAWRLHRAALPHELNYSFAFEDSDTAEDDTYYARVRQKNDQWAWSSAIFCRG
jgi:hypothetical protein